MNIRRISIDEFSAPRYIMPIIVSSCQHCDEQQFRTLSCVHYPILSVYNRKLDLFIRALVLDHILALKKGKRTPHVHLVFDASKSFDKINHYTLLRMLLDRKTHIMLVEFYYFGT